MKGLIKPMDMYGFYTGKIIDAYEYLGCHYNKSETFFRTFAPAASHITVTGDFNNWTETPMNRVYNGAFWECEIQNVKPGDMYKYRIYKTDGSYIDHCDPYGFQMELRPNFASIVTDLSDFEFNDKKWIKNRTDCKKKPLNIYEVHLGSWKNNKNNENGWYSYSELKDLLIPYVKEHGYTHIEIMPLSEHPCDNSWGYQCTGFYSPTKRYGTPNELKEFINECHLNEIGVILDFVPVHFAVDSYGLAEYDGTFLYEYPNSDVGYSEWGSKNFMHSRGEVQSFLNSCANYWIKEFHFDGLRIDALSNIIYWHGDKNRGVNNNAVEFIRHMNDELKKSHKGIMLIAEDSTAFPNVTKPLSEGGLGFDYKWDMGWMNDTLEYFKNPASNRSNIYHKLTFSMMYYYSENFLLPLSHDEVVHGKATIVQKMNGDNVSKKFSQAMSLYMYMYAHPGKKLNFMGNELGQLREWDERREQDWNLLGIEEHKNFFNFFIDLNKIYISEPSFSAYDHAECGFNWIDCHQEEKCIYAFERISDKNKIIAVFNFSDKVQEYELSVKNDMNISNLKVILYNPEKEYNGSGIYKKGQRLSVNEGKVLLKLEPFSGLFLKV